MFHRLELYPFSFVIIPSLVPDDVTNNEPVFLSYEYDEKIIPRSNSPGIIVKQK